MLTPRLVRAGCGVFCVAALISCRETPHATQTPVKGSPPNIPATDSAATIAECIVEASRSLGLRAPDATRARHVIGLGLHDAMRIAVPDLPASRYAEFVAAYRSHFLARKDSMRLFAGMRELLEELSGSHLLAIATGKSRQGLDRDIEYHGLKPLFAASN